MSYLSTQRLLAPIGAISIPATIATLGAVVAGGPPGWVVAAITVAGIVAASIFTWRWQLRLSEVERRILKIGPARKKFRLGVLSWLILGALAIGHLVVEPFPESSAADGTMAELIWNISPGITALVAYKLGSAAIKSRLVTPWHKADAKPTNQ